MSKNTGGVAVTSCPSRAELDALAEAKAKARDAYEVGRADAGRHLETFANVDPALTLSATGLRAEARRVYALRVEMERAYEAWSDAVGARSAAGYEGRKAAG